MLLDTLILFHSQARCPELCVFLLWNVLSSPGGRSCTAVLVPSHVFMLIRLLMTFIGSSGTRRWNLLMPDLLMSVPTIYPWAARSAISAATAGTYPVLPAGNVMKTFSVTYHLWKLHGNFLHVNRYQSITVSVCYFCIFRLYGPVA